MTFLQLINNVLRRMREDTVSAVNETTYSTMVQDFINDAKREVEDAWDWSMLRTSYVITTAASDYQYSLTGAGNKTTFVGLFDTTNKTNIRYKPYSWIKYTYDTQTVPEGTPMYFTHDVEDANGDTQILLYPTPAGVYTLNYYAYENQADLSAADDILLVPSAPVIHLAVAMLARERGETGGTSVVEYFRSADKALADAISLDAAKNEEKTIFGVV